MPLSLSIGAIITLPPSGVVILAAPFLTLTDFESIPFSAALLIPARSASATAAFFAFSPVTSSFSRAILRLFSRALSLSSWAASSAVDPLPAPNATPPAPGSAGLFFLLPSLYFFHCFWPSRAPDCITPPVIFIAPRAASQRFPPHCTALSPRELRYWSTLTPISSHAISAKIKTNIVVIPISEPFPAAAFTALNMFSAPIKMLIKNDALIIRINWENTMRAQLLNTCVPLFEVSPTNAIGEV